MPTNNRPKFFEPEYLSFEKKQILVRLEPKTLAVPGVFVTSRLSVQETLRDLSFFMNQGTTRRLSFVNKVVYGGKKSSTQGQNKQIARLTLKKAIFQSQSSIARKKNCSNQKKR